jgi:ubiquinone/menaquinone biosynthesis C-methylase UbiE
MIESTFLSPAEALEAAHLHEGMQVADLGSGSGFFTRAAARLVGESGVVWAVDTNQDLLPRIKNLAQGEGLHNVEVIQGDAEVAGGTHLPRAAFDIVIAANLLFGLEEKHECIAEIRRILKNNGQAIVIDWTGSHGGLGPHPSHVISREEAQKLFEQQHFAFVRNIPAGQYHWGFMVRKKAA